MAFSPAELCVGAQHKMFMRFDARCLTCEKKIKSSERAVWCVGIGFWHAKCRPPRGLSKRIEKAIALREGANSGRR